MQRAVRSNLRHERQTQQMLTFDTLSHNPSLQSTLTHLGQIKHRSVLRVVPRPRPGCPARMAVQAAYSSTKTGLSATSAPGGPKNTPPSDRPRTAQRSTHFTERLLPARRTSRRTRGGRCRRREAGTSPLSVPVASAVPRCCVSTSRGSHGHCHRRRRRRARAAGAVTAAVCQLRAVRETGQDSCDSVSCVGDSWVR